MRKSGKLFPSLQFFANTMFLLKFAGTSSQSNDAYLFHCTPINNKSFSTLERYLIERGFKRTKKRDKDLEFLNAETKESIVVNFNNREYDSDVENYTIYYYFKWGFV